MWFTLSCCNFNFVLSYAIFPPNPNSQIFRIDKKIAYCNSGFLACIFKDDVQDFSADKTKRTLFNLLYVIPIFILYNLYFSYKTLVIWNLNCWSAQVVAICCNFSLYINLSFKQNISLSVLLMVWVCPCLLPNDIPPPSDWWHLFTASAVISSGHIIGCWPAL